MGSKSSKHDKELEFIQATAIKLGLSNDFLESKAELYAEYAAEDKLLSLSEFTELYKELSHEVFEDQYLEDYVKAIFRSGQEQTENDRLVQGLRQRPGRSADLQGVEAGLPVPAGARQVKD